MLTKIIEQWKNNEQHRRSTMLTMNPEGWQWTMLNNEKNVDTENNVDNHQCCQKSFSLLSLALGCFYKLIGLTLVDMGLFLILNSSLVKTIIEQWKIIQQWKIQQWRPVDHQPLWTKQKFDE